MDPNPNPNPNGQADGVIDILEEAPLIDLLLAQLLPLSVSCRFVLEDGELVQNYLTPFIVAVAQHLQLNPQLTLQNIPEEELQNLQALAFAPMRVMLGQIDVIPEVLVHEHHLQLRTGPSTYIITNELPMLHFPINQRWRAGRRRNVWTGNQLVGSRSDYYLLDPVGEPEGWSMFIYRTLNDNAPFMLVRYVRRA